MPGYGIAGGPDGMLTWSDAQARLVASHDFWIATVDADGRPAVTPVWGVWADDALWFSCSGGSRKARNLTRDPRLTATTDDPYHPVIVEGVATRAVAPPVVATFTIRVNEKYDTDYGEDFFAENWVVRLDPERVLALDESAFATSPTRWTFTAAPPR